MKFDGIYTPIVTPYKDDHSIHFDAIEEIVEELLSCGVHGIVIAGTTGEYYAQSQEERLQVMKTCKEAVNGRVPLIIGTGAIRTEDCVLFAEEAAKVGADGILVSTPPYVIPTERENALHALAIDRAANLPIMLYNYPGRTGAMMGEEFLDRVCRSSNFCAIKE